MVDGQTWSVFEPHDVPVAIHKLLGARDAPAYFFDDNFMTQLEKLLAKCGISDVAASIVAVVGMINATQAEHHRQLRTFSVPTVCGPSGGASGSGASVTLRVCDDHNGETLISAIDELDWLGLDGRHAWHNWLKDGIEDLIVS